MQCSRLLSLVATAFLLLAVGTLSVAYISVPLEPVPNKVALADCVVVGKITSLGKKPVRAPIYPGAEKKFDFTVAEVEVREALVGAEKGKCVRLGFLDVHVKSGQYKPAPAVGQEGCFFAVKNPTGDFYLLPTGGFYEAKGKSFAKNLALARRCIRLLAKPEEELKSRMASDRLLTAYLLILRDTYRPLRYYGSRVKAEPMDAQRSKLLMLALAEADCWTRDPETGASAGIALGWLQRAQSDWPKTFPKGGMGQPEVITATKRWLKENADSYCLRRLVPVKPEVKE